MVDKSREQFYIDLAVLISNRSKDVSTKVGAVIINDNKILSFGYNGAPHGFPDDKLPKEHSDILHRDKNTYMVHAELNAILNYSGHMSDFKGSTIYCTLSPCVECTKALIQAGVTRIVYLNEYKKDILLASKILCKIANVSLEKFKG